MQNIIRKNNSNLALCNHNTWATINARAGESNLPASICRDATRSSRQSLLGPLAIGHLCEFA